MRSTLSILIAAAVIAVACETETQEPRFESLPPSAQTISLVGDTLPTMAAELPEPLSVRIDSLSQQALLDDDLVDHYIWEGRRSAYFGDYRRAIEQFSAAIEEFPEEARLYRHRGHRYITLREFDLAIQDFKKAAELFESEPDITEQDGLPNAQNIPLSSLQTNTWYHLGLAHYLKGEYAEAIEAYQNGLEVSDNEDMRIAFLYWYYMALRKQGKDIEAGQLLDDVSTDIELIENTSYYELLMVFKGVFEEDELFGCRKLCAPKCYRGLWIRILASYQWADRKSLSNLARNIYA